MVIDALISAEREIEIDSSSWMSVPTKCSSAALDRNSLNAGVAFVSQSITIRIAAKNFVSLVRHTTKNINVTRI